ncbi:hypothetical protein RJ639_001890 [Escallonia herrerae]|uniref:Lipoxygenase domain-containing protein n=1 Tax=Escallonia herrerae TaxID=1293975 RepID=A0AA88XH32_9ASTE|nr:hypothetical protein RJ639_001890 [Escallonia herrerae]
MGKIRGLVVSGDGDGVLCMGVGGGGFFQKGEKARRPGSKPTGVLDRGGRERKDWRWMTEGREGFRKEKVIHARLQRSALAVREQNKRARGTTLYGSTTLFFLTKKGTLRPVAIELTRPPGNGKPQWKHV